MIDVKQLRETANAFAGWGADLDMRPSEVLELLDRLEAAEREAEQARISSERGMKRNAGVELYEALEELVEQSSHPDISGRVNIVRAVAALTKARGES